MIQARRALFSHLRLFVERELVGLFTWNDVREGVTYPSEMIGKFKNRRNPLGDDKEIVEICLGAYVIRVSSPVERGPCGLVEFVAPDAVAVEIGPLDQSSFNRLGEIIRKSESVRV